MTIDFHKWTKINQFHNVRKLANKLRSHKFNIGEPFEAKFKYRGKIKLDGTNAAIRLKGGTYACQSRGRIITPEDDNYGFAQWAKDNEDWVMSHVKTLDEVSELNEPYDMTIYGEWAGPGVQRRTSISKIDRRVFCVFAVRNHMRGTIIIDPEMIEMITGDHDDVYTIPWATDEIEVDWSDHDALQYNAEELNKLVLECERCDPFVKEHFGVEGLGEGFVFYPLLEPEHGIDFIQVYDDYCEWMFKAKGEEHQTQRQTKPVIVDAVKLTSTNAFVDTFVTLPRLEQGLAEVGEADMKSTGAFLKWFGNDVRSESADELEASGLVWKDVSKRVSTKAREWWMDQCQK